MLWNRQKLKTAVVACFLASTLAPNDCLFASTQLHPVLGTLRETGMNVSCCNDQVKPPKVELLEDMHFGLMPIFEIRTWMRNFFLGVKEREAAIEAGFNEEFQLGKTGIIAAVNGGEPQSHPEATEYQADPLNNAPSERQFQIAWDKAHQNRKVFLSFARPDLPHATKVKEALVSKGYAVFIYLNEESGRPKYEPEVAGRMFSEAGLRLVLDTSASQMSAGVRFEAAFDEVLRRKRVTTIERAADPAAREPGRVGEGKSGIIGNTKNFWKKLWEMLPEGTGEQIQRWTKTLRKRIW